MKKIFVVGGMGSGKSTVTHILTDQGLPYIDLDKVGHEIHKWDTVKEELREVFGDEVFTEAGEVDRSALAAKAFADPTLTRKLNRISMPRIEELYYDRIQELKKEGHDAVVVEYSVFKNREMSLAYDADVVIAVLAPIEMRVARAVASGWDELDVRRRISHQITDADRAEAADVSFNNDGTPEQLRQQVLAWWDQYKETM